MSKRPATSELNRLVSICSSRDYVKNGFFCLERDVALDVWASISPLSSGSSWTPGGYDTQTKPTNLITIQAMPDIDITRTAWIFEDRIISSGRWYKILEISETEDALWWMMKSRVEQKSDSENPDNGSLSGLNISIPSKVRW